jgi:hypothetical protein
LLIAVALLCGCVVGAATTHDRQWQTRFAVGIALFLTTAMVYPPKAMSDFGMQEDKEDHDK